MHTADLFSSPLSSPSCWQLMHLAGVHTSLPLPWLHSLQSHPGTCHPSLGFHWLLQAQSVPLVVLTKIASDVAVSV